MRCRSIYLAILALSVVLSACHREEKVKPEKVMILYSAGYNSLSSYLQEDIEDLLTGYIPQKNDKNILVVVSHQTASYRDYTTKTEPCLFRVYQNKSTVVCDTLMRLEAGTSSLTPDAVRSFMTYIKTTWPADSYGMVFSSHGSGWLPENYYINGEPKNNSASLRGARTSGTILREPEHNPEFPLTKSIGPENINSSGSKYDVEIGLEQFASSIPVHLDYLLFDACFMGCVETAYSLRKVADAVGFSPAEVLAEGFDYTTMSSHLLQNETPDPKAVCDSYYQQYIIKTGYEKAATITLVKTSGLDALASVCKSLYSKYSESISTLTAKQVQGFFGGSKNWFFDLKDILEQAGASSEDLSALDAALNGCIIYKNHTGQYVSAIDGLHQIRAYCGLSTFLPSLGTDYLKSYYKTLSWNSAAGLVK